MANAGTGNAVPATNVFSQNAGAAPVNGDMPGFTKEQLDAGSAFWATAPTAEAIAEAAQRNNLTAEQVASSWAQSGYGSYDQGLQNIGQYMQSVQPTTPAPVAPAPAPAAPAPAPVATAPQQPQRPNMFSTAATGVNTAMGGATNEMNYQPMTVSAGQIAGTNLSAYMNPYESQVVDQSLSDLERARQMQAMQLNAQATRAGAFGGSRQALMQSELGRNYLDQAARTASGLRQAGFQSAQQLAGQDIEAQLRANLANQSANLAASQQRLAAAGQLGNLSNLGFGMATGIQDRAMLQGALERSLNQAVLDAARNQYTGAVNAPGQSLAYLNQAVGASPAPTTTTQSRDPGIFDYLTLAASI